MRSQNDSEISSSRYHLACARVMLYGKEGTIVRWDQYCRIAARLQHNNSAIMACLQRELARVRKVQRLYSLARSSTNTRSPKFAAQKKNSGRSLVTSHFHYNHVFAETPSPTQSYKQASVRQHSCSPSSAADINELVARLEPTLTKAIVVLVQRNIQKSARTSRTFDHFYSRGRSSLQSLRKREFDESKHPRAPVGHSDGGQFVSAQDAISLARREKGDFVGDDTRPVGRLDLERLRPSRLSPAHLASPALKQVDPAPGVLAHWAPTGGSLHTNNLSEHQLAGVTATAQVVPLLATNALGNVGSEVVGHHPLPIAVLKDAYVRRKITVDAFKLATETYFKNPNHGWNEYGGIHHKDYNKAVERELHKLVTVNKAKPIDKDVMETFLKNLTEGKGANGKINRTIKDFNEAVLGIAGDALKKSGETLEKAGSRNIDDVIRRCDARRVFWANRFMGAALVGVTGALSANAQAAVTAVGSEHLRRAVGHLNDGNIREAESEIFGPDRNGISGLISEIEKNGSPLAAQNAQRFFEELFTRLPNEKAEVIRILEGKHKVFE